MDLLHIGLASGIAGVAGLAWAFSAFSAIYPTLYSMNDAMLIDRDPNRPFLSYIHLL